MHPRTLLLILLGVVPVVVVIAVLVSFLLLRAGYGLVVAGVVPFAAMFLVVVVMGVAFGRAASKSRAPGQSRDRDHSSRGPGDGQSRPRDDV